MGTGGREALVLGKLLVSPRFSCLSLLDGGITGARLRAVPGVLATPALTQGSKDQDGARTPGFQSTLHRFPVCLGFPASRPTEALLRASERGGSEESLRGVAVTLSLSSMCTYCARGTRSHRTAGGTGDKRSGEVSASFSFRYGSASTGSGGRTGLVHRVTQVHPWPSVPLG